MNTIKEILRHGLTKGSKSNALQPLSWLLGSLIAGFLTAIGLGASYWILITLASLIGVAILLFIIAYIYFMITNPDFLRSEKYSLSKMAIEKGYYGDSDQGFFKHEIDQDSPTKELPEPNQEEQG